MLRRAEAVMLSWIREGMGMGTEPVDQKVLEIVRNGMTPRQQRLNSLWAWYLSLNYENRNFNWDGSKVLPQIDADNVSASGFVPGDYWENDGIPLRFRRPSAPTCIPPIVVDRFTGLLFSKERHPTFDIVGDPEAEDYVNALASTARLWPAWIEVRTFGGATGVAVAGFKFIDGKPRIEVHDPRWCYPTWADREELHLEALEKRYAYPEEVFNPGTKLYETKYFWYRRKITAISDTVYNAVEVTTEEPEWTVKDVVEHNFGFCPVVWVQNTKVSGDIDGSPDCAGAYPACEQTDYLNSQADRGTLSNCDPTLAMFTDKEFDNMLKGSSNAVRLGQGDDAKYLEISAMGIEMAKTLAEQRRAQALDICKCVLDHPDVHNRTATEVERMYSAMLSKADCLREQYGERGVLALMSMMVKAVRIIEGRGEAVVLPPRFITPDNATDGAMVEQVRAEPQRVERTLGDEDIGGMITLKWGPYFDATSSEVNIAVDAASKAKMAHLIDGATATRFVAGHFGVHDVPGMLRRIASEEEAEKEEAEALMMASIEAKQSQAELTQKDPTITRDDNGAPAKRADKPDPNKSAVHKR
jgi:hypothetical protein